jgi:hypothetical protein
MLIVAVLNFDHQKSSSTASDSSTQVGKIDLKTISRVKIAWILIELFLQGHGFIFVSVVFYQ